MPRYIPWRDRPGYRPMFVSGFAKTFWVPPRYVDIARATIDGKRFSMRDLAKRTGYSLSALWEALRKMASWGFFRIITKRGRYGFTRLVFAQDFEGEGEHPRANVRPHSPKRTSLPEKRDRTVTPNIRPGDGYAEWRAVGELLR